MKVDGGDAPAETTPVRSTPAPGRFREALERAAPREPAPGPRRPAPAPTAGLERPGDPAPGQGPRPAAPATRVARTQDRVLATARSALASPENLGQARRAMHAEATRLGTTRSEGQAQGQERLEHRLVELIAREAARNPRSVPAPAPTGPRGGGEAPAAARERPLEAALAESRPPPSMSPASTSDVAPVTPPTRAGATAELIEKIELFVRSQRPALGLSLRGGLDATVEVERTGPREVALRIQGRHGPVPTEALERLRDALEARGLRLSALHAG